MVKTNTRFIKLHRKLIIFSSILVLALATVAGRMIYERSVVNEMRAIANQIQADPSWTLTSEHHLAPQIACIADEPCPNYEKVFATKDPVTQKALNDLVTSTSWTYIKDTTCLEASNLNNSALTTCTKIATYNGYNVSLYYNKSSSRSYAGTLKINVTR